MGILKVVLLKIYDWDIGEERTLASMEPTTTRKGYL